MFISAGGFSAGVSCPGPPVRGDFPASEIVF